MMAYAIFTSYEALKVWQSQLDTILGYPEPLESLVNVGLGPWADKELGRAMHFAEVIKHPTEDWWAIWGEGIATKRGHLPAGAKHARFADVVTLPPGASEHEELPGVGWFPELP